MNLEITGHLVGPQSGQSLRLEITRRDGETVIAGRLWADGEGYAIEHGIPRFVTAGADQSQTIRSFDQKWSRHRYYRSHTAEFYTQWYLARYGFLDRKGLSSFLRGKRFILDAGTGLGRDALNFMQHSEATVMAVDTSIAALQTAAREIAHPRVAFIQADAANLPFPDEFFDFINCDQVIHHTPDPRATFDHLRRKLRTGGHVCCYVYRRKGPIREFTDDYVRARVRHLNIDDALSHCEGITKLGRALASLRVRVDIEEDIPLLGIPKGRYDVQRLFHWCVMKCFWNPEFDFFTNNVVNLDWYHPEHCFRFAPEEFHSWFEDGWDIEAWDVQEAGISCRARKR